MFKQALSDAAALMQRCLADTMAPMGDLPVVQGMRYAVDGGKGLRGFFVIESARLHGIDPVASVYAAAAIEAMHAYSLVHDDLPCMDDDDLRRGQPTVHKKWDDATAVLVGDGLQSLAFELLAHPALGTAEVRMGLVSSLAQSAGAQGMVLGQAQDIAAETADVPLSLDQIMDLQSNKTGALIEWACTAGAVMGGGDRGPMRRYARHLGLAFQIADDILDVEGDAKTAGKRLQKDAEAGKATFVSLLGIETAKLRAAELVQLACDALDPFGRDADVLRDAAKFVVTRDR